jgi:hypothetical protein
LVLQKFNTLALIKPLEKAITRHQQKYVGKARNTLDKIANYPTLPSCSETTPPLV